MDWFEENGERVRSTAMRIAQLVREHQQAFADSASATSNQLVVPMLRALGWDCDDPARVQFRDPGSDGFGPVLRLSVPDRAGAIILVTPLGGEMKTVSPELIQELVTRIGVEVVAQTDGDRWRIYRRDTGWEPELKRQSEDGDHMRGYGLYLRLHESRLAASTSSPTEPSATREQPDPKPAPVEEPPSTVSRAEPEPTTATVPEPSPEPATTRTAEPAISRPRMPTTRPQLGAKPEPGRPQTPASTARGWQSLDQLPSIDRAPSRVRYPDGTNGKLTDVPTRSISGTYAAVGRYLAEAGKIDPDHLPLGITRTKNAVFNAIPEHPTGRPFTRPVQLADRIWMETMITTSYFADYARRIFKAVDADPSLFEFNFDQPARKRRPRVEDGGWVSVASLSGGNAVVGRLPRGVQTHNGRNAKVTTWHEAYQHVVQDLVDDGFITHQHLPIELPRARGKALASTSPNHSNGVPFKSPLEVRDGMYFETAGTYVQIVRWMRHLLEIAGLSQESVKIQFATVMRAGPLHKPRRGRPPKTLIVDDSFLKGKHWHRLSRDINVRRQPIQIRFGDDERHPVTSWRHLYQTVINHLLKNTTLAQAAMPVSVTTGNRCAVNRAPMHEDGKLFGAPRALDGGLWLEAGYPNDQVLRNMLRMLEKFDYPPENVGVRFA